MLGRLWNSQDRSQRNVVSKPYRYARKEKGGKNMDKKGFGFKTL